MGFVVNESERTWQAKCIYELFKRHDVDIDHALRNSGPVEGILRITNFENCRERGYTLTLGEKEISFSEHRKSDNIVVYPFKWDEHENPNREVDYEHKTKYFKFQQFQEVFDYILEYLEIEL